MRRVAGVAMLVVIGGATASGQQPFGPGRGFPDPPLGPRIDILGVQPLEMLAPVLGAPFSAETVSELVQEFVDGNRIEQRMVGSIARDGLGRVRREMPLGVGGGVRIVTITVPDERTQYRLDNTNKIAWRLRMPPATPDREVAARRPLAEGVGAEQLTASLWEGLRIEGTRTTSIIPVNAIGNQRAIDVISERWYSPDLQIVVKTYHSDPRTGKATYKLVKLVRGEPSTQLFEIPSGFTVRDERPFGPPPPPASGS
jgi:hypothetical protein